MNQRQHRRQRYIQMSVRRQPDWLFHHQLQMNMDSNLCPTLKITFKDIPISSVLGFERFFSDFSIFDGFRTSK